MLHIFALTARGLEPIAAAEMASLPGLTLGEVSYRRVAAAYAGDPAALLALKTVDDVFFELSAWDGLVPQRSALARISQLSASLPLQQALDQLRQFMNAPSFRWGAGGGVSFSVTANFVGKRNYSSDEIKLAVRDGLLSVLPWRYADENESDLNIRLFIEQDQARIGLRLSPSPLHARAYKQANTPGSLKPTVAAAMLVLAGLQPGHLLLDPFCGAGTIPIEGALLRATALGGDQDPVALQAAAANAARARVALGLCRWDGLRLPLACSSIDRLVTNLPWGRQVSVDAGLEAFYRAACAEIERLLVPGGSAVLLTSLPGLLRFERLSLLRTLEIGLFGQSPSILVYQS